MPAFEAQDSAAGPSDGPAARAGHAEGARPDDPLVPEAPSSQPAPPKRSSPARGILIAAVPAALLWWGIIAGLHALFQHRH